MTTLLKGALAACIGVLAASAATSQEVTELRFAVQTPPMVHYNKDLFIPWTEKVAADSNGTLKISMFFAGALGNEGQYVDIVESGAADIALDLPTYYPGRFPLAEVAALPLMIEGSKEGSEALWSLYEQGLYGNAFDGMKMLAISTPPAGTIMTTKQTVTVPADMEGLKIAGGGKTRGAIIEAAGAVPVNVKISELYQALDRNTVDGAMSFYTAIPPFKLNEVAKHYLDVPLGGSFMMVFMSQDRFDSLPDDAKAAIEKNSGAQFSADFGAVWDAANEAGRGMALASGGEISTPDEAQAQEWETAFNPVIDQWAAENDGGVEIVQALREALGK